MGYGNCVLTLATPENIEAVGTAGIPYADEFDLTEKLQRVLRDGSLVHAYRQRAQSRVQKHYDWERIVDQYERCFRGWREAEFEPQTTSCGDSPKGAALQVHRSVWRDAASRKVLLRSPKEKAPSILIGGQNFREGSGNQV